MLLVCNLSTFIVVPVLHSTVVVLREPARNHPRIFQNAHICISKHFAYIVMPDISIYFPRPWAGQAPCLFFCQSPQLRASHLVLIVCNLCKHFYCRPCSALHCRCSSRACYKLSVNIPKCSHTNTKTFLHHHRLLANTAITVDYLRHVQNSSRAFVLKPLVKHICKLWPRMEPLSRYSEYQVPEPDLSNLTAVVRHAYLYFRSKWSDVGEAFEHLFLCWIPGQRKCSQQMRTWPREHDGS